MALSTAARLRLTSQFNSALKQGDIVAAANIDAEFRDLISDETLEKQKSKSAKFRAEALTKYRANYMACLKHQYILAHQQDRKTRAQEISNDFASLRPIESEAVEFTESVTTAEFFKRKLEVIEQKFAQAKKDVAAITPLIESLNEMQVAVARRKEKLRKRVQFSLSEEDDSPDSLELEQLHALEAKIKERIVSYADSRDAVPVRKNKEEDVVLAEVDRLMITSLVESYFSHVQGESKDSEQGRQVAHELSVYIKDNPARQNFAGTYLARLVKLDPKFRDAVEAESELVEISLVDEEPIPVETGSKQTNKTDVDKYLFKMNSSFGRFFYQTRFLVSAYKFLNAVKNINVDDLTDTQRSIVNTIFSRAEFSDLLASSQKLDAKPAFKRLGKDFADFRSAFNQKFNLLEHVNGEGSRTRIRYRNAFAITRFSNYVARKTKKTKQNVESVDDIEMVTVKKKKSLPTIGFRMRAQLKRKFDRALKQGKLSKASRLDEYFNGLIAHEETTDRSAKLAEFRKALTDEHYLDMLVVRYRHAVEAGEDVKVAQVAEEFVRLAPNERKGELSATTVTIAFLKHEIDLLTNEAAVFDAMHFSQKTPEDIEKEKRCLHTLLAKLMTLKERLGTEGELLGETLLKSNDAESTPSPQRLMPTDRRLPGKSPGVIRLPDVSRKQVVRRHARVSQAQDATQEHALLGKAKVITVERNPSHLQMMKLDKKIEKYKQQKRELHEHESNLGNNNNEVIVARPITNEIKVAFQSVLAAFSPKTGMARFFKSFRKPFEHQQFIDGLEVMATQLCAPQEGNGGEVKPLDIQERDVALTMGLVNLFQQLEIEDLEKLYSKVNHAMYKNFFRGLKYYVDWTGASPNLVKLGFDEGNDSAQAFCMKLHNLNDLFIKALRRALSLKRIPFKDYFEDNEVVQHEGVYPVNQEFIRGYIQGQLDEVMKEANSPSNQRAVEHVM